MSRSPITNPPPWQNTTAGPGARESLASNSRALIIPPGPGTVMSSTVASSPTGGSATSFIAVYTARAAAGSISYVFGPGRLFK